MAGTDLRPMSLGEVLDRTFTLYREHFLLFAGITSLPYLGLLAFRFLALLAQRSAIRGAGSAPSLGAIGGILLGSFGVGILMILAVGIAHAATVWTVSELYLGRNPTVRDAYANSKSRALAVVGISIMVGIATGIGLIFLIIPGIYLACRLAVSVPAAIIEKQSPVASMERSMELTNGQVWPMFLLLLLVFVLTYIIGGVLQLPVFVFAFKAAMTKQQVSLGMSIYSIIAEFLSQVLVGPIGTISASLMYYNLRVQKEGFDIQHLLSSLSAPAPVQQPQGL